MHVAYAIQEHKCGTKYQLNRKILFKNLLPSLKLIYLPFTFLRFWERVHITSVCLLFRNSRKNLLEFANLSKRDQTCSNLLEFAQICSHPLSFVYICSNKNWNSCLSPLPPHSSYLPSRLPVACTRCLPGARRGLLFWSRHCSCSRGGWVGRLVGRFR